MSQKRQRSLTYCYFPCVLSSFLIAFFLLFPSSGQSGAPVPPEMFGDDYYKVYGTPDLTLSLERSTVYQEETQSLFITLTNRGRITSFQVNEEPRADKREEILAAGREQELEKLRTVAQDVSVEIVSKNKSAIEVKRAVAFPGSIREGQTSGRLEFPIEVYKNARPGQYNLYALVNYTYQRDVAVKSDQDRPENPNVYYWYDRLNQIIPITLKVERRSGAEFRVLEVRPEQLQAGSRDNVIVVKIENTGDDTARGIVARLRPESGIYVSVDMSPIPALLPGGFADLIYKLDVSKEAVPGKQYMLKILFEFSDSLRDDLTDSQSAYITVENPARGIIWPIAALGTVIAAALIVYLKRRERG